jgi:hypothetical protein
VQALQHRPQGAVEHALLRLDREHADLRDLARGLAARVLALLCLPQLVLLRARVGRDPAPLRLGVELLLLLAADVGPGLVQLRLDRADTALERARARLRLVGLGLLRGELRFRDGKYLTCT